MHSKKCPDCGETMVYDAYLKLMVHGVGGNIFCVYGNVNRNGLAPSDAGNVSFDNLMGYWGNYKSSRGQP